jgi:hypothetical protein
MRRHELEVPSITLNVQGKFDPIDAETESLD